MDMPRRPVLSQPEYYACMLNRPVFIVKLGAHRTHILSLGIHKQLFNPVKRNHLRIIVQQDNIFSPRLGHAQIINLRVIELSVVLEYTDIRRLLERLIIIKDFVAPTVILHHDNLIVVIGALLLNGSNAPP